MKKKKENKNIGWIQVGEKISFVPANKMNEFPYVFSSVDFQKERKK